MHVERPVRASQPKWDESICREQRPSLAGYEGARIALEASVKERTNTGEQPLDTGETYTPPAIEWVEVMEEAGVYAACAKDSFEPLSEGCYAFPMSGAS